MLWVFFPVICCLLLAILNLVSLLSALRGLPSSVYTAIGADVWLIPLLHCLQPCYVFNVIQFVTVLFIIGWLGRKGARRWSNILHRSQWVTWYIIRFRFFPSYFFRSLTYYYYYYYYLSSLVAYSYSRSIAQQVIIGHLHSARSSTAWTAELTSRLILLRSCSIIRSQVNLGRPLGRLNEEGTAAEHLNSQASERYDQRYLIFSGGWWYRLEAELFDDTPLHCWWSRTIWCHISNADTSYQKHPTEVDASWW